MCKTSRGASAKSKAYLFSSCARAHLIGYGHKITL
jgi:hypothetical protein